MEGRQRRSFTDDYKRQAVDLVASSGRSIGSVAKELGLRDSVLRRWVELRGAGRGLRGVKLVASDAHEGIKAAVSKVLTAGWQRSRSQNTWSNYLIPPIASMNTATRC